MLTFRYRCSICNAEYERDTARYLCPVCSRNNWRGLPLQGVLEVIYSESDLRILANKQSTNPLDWLPIEPEFYPPLSIGNTPLLAAKRLGVDAGVRSLFVKYDGLNPSGSLKDRASWLVIGEALRLRESTIVAASTGNAASSLAAIAASAGLQSVIFVPASAPLAKLVQIAICGAHIVPVAGSYDDAFALSLAYTEQFGGLNRNTAYHPLTIEGKKTAGLEIHFQLGQVPDVIIIPVGDGVILSGIHKAYRDLHLAGIIDRLPRLIAVQAEHSAAIHHFFVSNEYSSQSNPNTIADSISVSTPSNAYLAVRALRESHGCTVLVSDEEIRIDQKVLAETSGIFAEPAAAASLSGLKQGLKLGLISPDETAVLLVTGHGLKDIATAQSSISLPEPIQPDPTRLDAVYDRVRGTRD